jgi:hypothetical protein
MKRIENVEILKQSREEFRASVTAECFKVTYLFFSTAGVFRKYKKFCYLILNYMIRRAKQLVMDLIANQVKLHSY